MDAGRLLASLAAGVAAVALVAQAVVVAGLVPGGLGLLLVVMAAFFTIWANLGVVGTLGLAALRGRPLPPAAHGAALSWILLTGIVFHILLAREATAAESPFGQGLGLWAAHGLHTVVPLLALLHWIVAAPKRGLGWRHAALWLLLPLGYLVLLGVGIAQSGGSAPYPFLDAAALGWGGVARALGLLVAGALALNGAIVGAARALTRGRALPGGGAPAGPPPR